MIFGCVVSLNWGGFWFFESYMPASAVVDFFVNVIILIYLVADMIDWMLILYYEFC